MHRISANPPRARLAWLKRQLRALETKVAALEVRLGMRPQLDASAVWRRTRQKLLAFRAMRIDVGVGTSDSGGGGVSVSEASYLAQKRLVELSGVASKRERKITRLLARCVELKPGLLPSEPRPSAALAFSLDDISLPRLAGAEGQEEQQ